MNAVYAGGIACLASRPVIHGTPIASRRIDSVAGGGLVRPGATLPPARCPMSLPLITPFLH